MFLKSRIDGLRSICLMDVLLEANCEQNKNDKQKWNTPKGVISVNSQKFFNWTDETGGGGAIDLSIHLFDFDFRTSLNWLEKHSSVTNRPLKSLPPESKNSFQLPPRENDNLPRVVQYLNKKRCIPLDLVNKLVSDGKIYGDNEGNVVFLLLGKGRVIVGAELRGTSQRRWLGMAKGSRKDLGAFYVKSQNSKTVVICESAIDAISLFAIQGDCIAISTAGVNSNPAWLNKILIKRNFEVFCGFDSDETGDFFADRMIHTYPQIKRLRPYKHDWNEILKSTSNSSTKSPQQD